MTSLDAEPAFRDTRAAEVAGHAMAAAFLQAETPEQLDNTLEDIKEVLESAVPDITVSRRDRHEAEHDLAIKTQRLLDMSIIPAILPIDFKLSLIDKLIDNDARISEKLHDQRSTEERAGTITGVF